MARTFNSDSFLLTTTPQPWLTLSNPRFTVFAKRSPFQFAKAKDNPDQQGQAEDSSNSNPFRLNFVRRTDPTTVFPAGATGQAGTRTAQTLLRMGFTVRAGVPQLGDAQQLARLAVEYKRLNGVESSFQDAESIAKAIGNARKVVVTIGPGENGPSSEVSTADALQVIQAAQLAGVDHVAIVYDALTEDYTAESSYNVVVSAEGSIGANDYKEVDELFSVIPEDGRRRAYAEALPKAKAEEEAKEFAEKAREETDAEKRLKEETKKLLEKQRRASSRAEEAEGAVASIEGILSKANDISAGFSWENFSSQIATSVQKPSDEEKANKGQVATVGVLKVLKWFSSLVTNFEKMVFKVW
ncbi:Splicing factor PWI domain-containing protein, putative isoform 1 [Hibiscus syriacus]|uniref:Splicing factor PWI domain-containing protein, putative isoform 1 n=1 Tax=Hibiscus syriacus TaxID=106335 RepID=A0A6A2WYM3_HIBSY|nr:Splicing factor PWI domain-containing protein, putative isoform 1 [Hibiscus syriacus]